MEIEKLIVKYLVGCLSKEEDQILKKWLQEDESHLRFFQKISLDKTAVEDYRQYHRFDAKSDEAFRKVWTSLHKGTRRISTQRKIGFFSRRWLKIACALLILLFSVGGGLYFYYEASRITPGESKAILTLEDGSAKQLKKSSHPTFYPLVKLVMLLTGQHSLEKHYRLGLASFVLYHTLLQPRHHQ